MMQRADLVEKAGTGIKRINDAMENYRLNKPDLEYENIWFRIVFNRPDLENENYQSRMSVKNVGENVGENDTLNETLNDTLNDTQKKIINEIKNKPNITYNELVTKIDKSRSTIIRQMKDLKKKNIVKRIGSDKKGRWLLLN